MKQCWSLNSLAIASVTLAIMVGLATLYIPRTEAAGPHIDMYFMSALARSANPLDWCTGSGSPVIHPPGRAIDVIGDDSGSLSFNSRRPASR